MANRSQPTVIQLLREAQTALADTLRLSANEARIEAAMLMCRALGAVSRAWLIAHEQDAVQPGQRIAFDAMLQRRVRGEPMAYILGEREFFGLSFKVTPATLIPRPETELLVELALQRIPKNQNCRILDLGAGSGAIALSIAHARQNIEVVAVDASPDALEVAHGNAARLGIGNTAFVHSDWYAALGQQRFRVIVSNPPYIAESDAHLGEGDLRFEPGAALASGADGLDDIRHIVAGAQAHLEPDGWLLLEHGYDQAARVRQLLRDSGFAEVFSARDLAGIERVTGGKNPG